MSAQIPGKRMLADMQEPIADVVPLKAMEVSKTTSIAKSVSRDTASRHAAAVPSSLTCMPAADPTAAFDMPSTLGGAAIAVRHRLF